MSEQVCIFCKIIQKEIPARIIFESKDVIAFLDIAPATKGHTVVVPKPHFNNLTDMPEEIMENVFKDLKQVGKLLMEKLNVEGFNLIQNNFEIAGQVVPHAHFHIIPRYEGDKIRNLQKNPKQAVPENIDIVFSQII
ncbi:MAG: HIT family protein [Promethearchaeota archaeon]